jgi:tyrosyl-tRNA synthetase
MGERNVYQVLKERGFVYQVTEEEELEELLGREKITCYIGFDPTAKSFHVGNLLPILALVHFQRHGHRVIALLGGGTGLIGDPSGKKEARPLMSLQELEENSRCLQRQLTRFLDFEGGRALLLNNAEWLTKLNYIEFLREIGRHFSVNRMLQAETYRLRYETTGLNFVEFNYMLLQAYDFLYLWRHYGCLLQMGGSDQWANICAGIELIRRVEEGKAYGLVFPLLTTATGEKMGKTEKGAVWLDPELTSPYEFYQYWINVDDRDVERFLGLFTFLPMDEVKRLGNLKGEEIRRAKEVLAFEVTKIVHGEEEAKKAREVSRALFGKEGKPKEGLPTTEIKRSELEAGILAYELLVITGLARTKSEARRLISQGGAYINDRRIESFDQKITTSDLEEEALILRVGKKKYHRVVAV